MKTRSGFTLIELLVVISVITLLLAIFMAALSKARQHTRAVICRSNLRQWGIVFRIHADDNDGKFFTGANPREGTWWPLQLKEEQKDFKRNKTWFCPTATRPRFDEAGTAVPYLSTLHAWGIWKGTAPINGYSFPVNGIAGSYGLNGYLLRITGDGYDGGVSSQCGWQSYPPPQTERVPVMLDALQEQLWPGPYDGPPKLPEAAWDSLPRMHKACINRHDSSVVALYGDTSTEKVGLKELWTLKWHRTFDTQGPWTKAGGVRPEDWPDWMRNLPDY